MIRLRQRQTVNATHVFTAYLKNSVTSSVEPLRVIDLRMAVWFVGAMSVCGPPTRPVQVKVQPRGRGQSSYLYAVPYNPPFSGPASPTGRESSHPGLLCQGLPGHP
jgi:hypothetical protein